MKNHLLKQAYAERLLVTPAAETLSMDSRETHINNNVVVVGGSGAGKTRGIALQNVIASSDSLIISDPKGTVTKECAEAKRKQGFDVYILDLIHPETSSLYNPMDFVQTEEEQTKLVHEIVFGQDGYLSNDYFWPQSAEIALGTVIAYLCDLRTLKTECPSLDIPGLSDRSKVVLYQIYQTPISLTSAFHLLRGMEPLQIANGKECTFERKVKALKTAWNLVFPGKPCRCEAQWAKFNQISEKTLSCILMTLHGILAPLDTAGIRQLMSDSEISFKTIGQKPTAIFVKISDTDRSKDTLANLFFAQAMNALCEYADLQPDGRLPQPVRFILDDFGTNCKIANFDKIISNIRAREISAMLLLQSQSQLTDGYGSSAHTILENCDTMFYLGGNDLETAQMIAQRCNQPLHKILNMPVSTHWMFRRGQQPRFAQTVDYSAYNDQTATEPSR